MVLKSGCKTSDDTNTTDLGVIKEEVQEVDEEATSLFIVRL
jgi:hypothetical protein